ncbi:MAG: NAD(P)H-dependent oxidoreductase [Trueperaceae bacterium]|nr:NAD(P)H-dependent oxidoreductase [Trueperaceae bacterium]
MTISLILAHPNPDSLNHALARSVFAALRESGHDVVVHDLYHERFDPCLTAGEIATHRSDDPLVERHAAEIQGADGLVLIHPNWFDQPPAILKGWVDRVIRDGTAFRRTADGGFEGLLDIGAALLVTTANAPYDAAAGDAIDAFWKGFVLPICGVSTVERLHLTPVVASSLEQRRAWLDEAAERAQALFPAG